MGSMIRRHICFTFVMTILVMSTNASSFEMAIEASEVDANVYDVTVASKKTHLGKAPLAFKKEEEVAGKVFLIEKPGFAPVYIPMAGDLKRGMTIHVDLIKSEEWTPEELTRKSMETAEKMVDQILSLQALLDARKTADALPLAENLKNTYPESVSARLVYANALLLSGDVTKADSIYGILLEEIPQSRKSMRDSIEAVRIKLRGGRVPASGGKARR